MKERKKKGFSRLLELAGEKKTLLVFDEPYHLIFNECIDKVLDPIALKLKEVKFR